jgi:uncharacterized protein YPO0396
VLRDLRQLCERPGDLEPDDFRDAARRLLERQFLLLERGRDRDAYRIVANHFDYFANLFDAIGWTLHRDDVFGIIGLLPGDAESYARLRLVGGDKRWWSPNASAGEKSTRSLRDYCLGVVRDPDNPELSREFQPRDQGLSYLVLVFRDEDGGEPTSIGLAMHARLDEAQETIDGRFIAQGLDLVLSDLVDPSRDGPVPKPWRRLREELRMRAGEAFRAHPQVGEYQRHLCAVLSDGRRHLDPTRFLRAFRNAITFAPIRNVSDFVRSYILEDRPIQVRSLQQALQHYRDIQIRTREAHQREEALAAIDRQYQRAEQAERLARAWRWVEQEAAFNALEAEMEPLREALDRGETEIAALTTGLGELDQQWQAADTALEEANRRLAATDVEQRRARIAAELEAQRQALARLSRDLEQARLGLGRVHRLLDHADQLQDPELAAGLRRLAPLITAEDSLLAASWPLAPAEVMAAVGRLAPCLTAAVARMRERYEALVREEGELGRALVELKARIEHLQQGGSDLQPNTRRLITLLQEHGIEATPLCDRVDLADEHWRDALEAFLGGHREALLVDPGQVRDAITLYRREGRRREIHGSRIVNTLKTDEWLQRRTAGSLAEVIISEDPRAVAYINRRAGNVLRVDSEDELIGHERAITADGMLASGGSVLRLRPEQPMLGREARTRTLESLQRRFAEDGQTHYRKQQEKQGLSRLREELMMPLERQLTDLPDLTALANARGETQDRVDELESEQRRLLDDAEYRRLQDEAARCRAEREEIARRREATVAKRTEREKLQASDRLKLEHWQTQSSAIAQQRTEIQQAPGFDAQLAAERLEELQVQELFAEESPASWRALGEDAGRRGAAQETGMRNGRTRAREQLNEYWAAWPGDNRPAGGGFDDHLPLAAWAVRVLTQLRETQLSQYVREAENALRQAEHAFRSDFVGKLQENLHLLEDQRKELNRNLRNRPFHSQYYSFKKSPEPDLRQVLDWVLDWSPEQGGDVGGLFDAAADPNHPHREAIGRVRSLLMEAAEGEGRKGGGWDERLADYRQYYHFDVLMSDERDGKGNPELLSRRLGKGSGGEHQSPFYVAIGAALAAAYRIERHEQGVYRSGIALAVFDEAFSKLDLQNTVSALGFLDELGLQVLLAAPDEKYGQIAEHVDTIVNVYRDGGNVHIDTEYIKPAAKQVLAADNPVLRPHVP